MAVLSVDLACRRWSDLGVVILSRAPGSGSERKFGSMQELASDVASAAASGGNTASSPASSAQRSVIQCEIVPFHGPDRIHSPDLGRIWDSMPGDDPVDAGVLAGRLNHLCATRGIRILVLDGPQAWKSAQNGLNHARAGERLLNTAAKTGLPGLVKPVTYRPYAEFCIDVYDALCRRGWRRLATRDHAPYAASQNTDRERAPLERVLVESYPYASWKSLGIKPLPSKRRSRIADLAESYAALNALIPIATSRPPNHDQLQAIVGGLAGLALEDHDNAAMRVVGSSPRREQGHWREGFIALPVVPQARVGIRWID